MSEGSFIPGGNIGAVAALIWALAAVPSLAQEPGEESQSITYEGLFIADWTRNIGGGANPDTSAGRYWLSLHLEADLEALIDLPGTTFGADLWQIAGDNGTDDVGSLQETSYLDADPDTLLAQAWLQHITADETLSLKFGRIDANEHFFATDTGANFHNAAVALPVTMMGIVSYPAPTEGGIVRYKCTEQVYVQAGGFDMDEPVWLAEFGYSPSNNVLFSAGGWYFTGDMECFNGSNCSGSSGYYFAAEGELAPQQIDLIGRISFADDSISPFGHHTALGFVWHEPISGREQDEVGLIHLHGDLSTAPGSPFQAGAEQIVESYYRFMLLDNVAIQPCLQYVSNPGGQYEDTWVPCVRIEVTF